MMNDTEAIKMALQGREEGFRAIFANHGNYLFTHALHLMKNREPAEDAVQEALTAAFRSLASFRGDAQLRTWLYRILRNTCLRMLEKKTATLQLLEKSGISDKTHEVEQRLDVSEILDLMSERERTILLLTYWDELPLKDSAATLETNENNAKIVLFRARRRFAELWQKHGRKEEQSHEM